MDDLCAAVVACCAVGTEGAASVTRTAVESAGLRAMRYRYGDEATAAWLAERDSDVAAAGRHTNQIETMIENRSNDG